MSIFRDLIKALLYVNEDGQDRISLTKTGSMIKQLGLWVGGSMTALQVFQGHQNIGIGLGITAAVLTGFGGWMESAGKRNTMDKK